MTKKQVLWQFIKAPLMGGAFALFLPFIGFAMLAYYITLWLTEKLTGRKMFADVTERT